MTIGLWKGRDPLSIAAGICSANELLAKCAPKRLNHADFPVDA